MKTTLSLLFLCVVVTATASPIGFSESSSTGDASASGSYSANTGHSTSLSGSTSASSKHDGSATSGSFGAGDSNTNSLFSATISDSTKNGAASATSSGSNNHEFTTSQSSSKGKGTADGQAGSFGKYTDAVQGVSQGNGNSVDISASDYSNFLGTTAGDVSTKGTGFAEFNTASNGKGYIASVTGQSTSNGDSQVLTAALASSAPLSYQGQATGSSQGEGTYSQINGFGSYPYLPYLLPSFTIPAAADAYPLSTPYAESYGV